MEGSKKNYKITVLYVDDEPANLNAFKAAFRRDFNILLAKSAPEGLSLLDKNEVHVLLTDQKMPEMTGIQFLELVLEMYPLPVRILITGYSDMDAVIDAINRGQVYKYISKPWDENYLKNIIEKSYEVYMLREENRTLSESLLQANKQLEFMLRQKLLS
jgi:response regulator RpfG family c-di-GMP phosphodiesterase